HVLDPVADRSVALHETVGDAVARPELQRPQARVERSGFLRRQLEIRELVVELARRIAGTQRRAVRRIGAGARRGGWVWTGGRIRSGRGSGEKPGAVCVRAEEGRPRGLGATRIDVAAGIVAGIAEAVTPFRGADRIWADPFAEGGRIVAGAVAV